MLKRGICRDAPDRYRYWFSRKSGYTDNCIPAIRVFYAPVKLLVFCLNLINRHAPPRGTWFRAHYVIVKERWKLIKGIRPVQNGSTGTQYWVPLSISGLICQVSCLSDALGMVGTKKEKVLAHSGPISPRLPALVYVAPSRVDRFG